MNYSDDDLIPLSYISQYGYCKRRAGLLLLEQQWEDNVNTAEGTIAHERVHAGLQESRGSIVILRSISLYSYKLGLAGKSDCIELTRSSQGYILPWIEGRWIVCPVEYKHGEIRKELEYELQVCAQAMCIEEMTGCSIEYGYLYYEGDRRRKQIIFDEQKRKLVIDTSKELHEMLRNRKTPVAIKSRKCPECSLKDICLPGSMKSTFVYISKLMKEARGEMK